MAKEDVSPHEEKDRPADEASALPSKPDSPVATTPDGVTQIKNAHATGDGTTGRSDEEKSDPLAK